MAKKSDNAYPSILGFHFQFEHGILALCKLSDENSYVSIESVDDVAVHDQLGTVISSFQDKHSIASTSIGFKDRSKDLWRTIEIWVDKLESGIFNSNTTFFCSANNLIDPESLVYGFANNLYEDPIIKIKELKKAIKEDRKAKNIQDKKTPTLDKIVELLNSVLKREEYLKTVLKNLKVIPELNPRQEIFSLLHLNSKNRSIIQKENIYHSILGWFIDNCIYKWKNGSEAKILKRDLDTKYQETISNDSISNAIFRNKDSIELDQNKVDDSYELTFVNQIRDLNLRDEVKRDLISDAIEDYLKYEIEHTFLIQQIGDFTKADFDKFLEACLKKWRAKFNALFPKKLSSYSADVAEAKAFQIFNEIINDEKILKFKEHHSFHVNNEYIKNGSFLKLSNIPKIGWHPMWEKKYGNE